MLQEWDHIFKVPDEDKNTLFEKTNTKLWLWANYIVIFFVLLSVAIVWIDSIPWFSKKYLIYIFIADFIISTVFLLEYIYRWKNSSNKIKFPFYFMNILDLLSFFPFFILIWIYWIWHYSIFALFRVLRIFRIFELVERLPIARKLIKGINSHRIEYLASIFVIFILLTIFSTLIYLIEYNWGNSNVFSSIPKTFWWAVVTMTTTWYWDMVPITFLWKLIATILMFLGPVIIAILSSITVLVFLDSTKIVEFNKSEKKCKNCWFLNSNNSNYCSNCWVKIKKTSKIWTDT